MECELLPCPFCGENGEFYQQNEDFYVISCINCNAESGYYDGEDSTTKDDAVTFWNTRKSPWRSIESAPKDGTYILIHIPKLDKRNSNNVREAKYFRYGMQETWRIRSGGIICIDRPTHWMPLPDAPEEV